MGQYDTWKYTKKYRETHIRRITLDVQTETYDRWKAFAETNDLKLATLIKQCVDRVVDANSQETSENAL